MALCYKKLWKLLIDHDMPHADLRGATGIAPATIAKMSRGESVGASVLERICASMQCNPNYRKGAFIDELARQGNVEPETAQIFQTGKQEEPPCPKPIQLYCHQTAALTMVAGDKSFVVTTGTGSGKSLTFFIPIVNRIIREKETDSSPRIRAIIVYPMNALANSQFEEIGKFLDGSNLVTVKRYTGQESATECTAIKKNPPDILLTNYVMLDLILTRHQEDHEVVEAAQSSERERRASVLEDVLAANKPGAELERRRRELKQIIKDTGSFVDARTIAALEKIGFKCVSGNKHWKLNYANVRIPISKTPSDHRAALNTATDIANRCF